MVSLVPPAMLGRLKLAVPVPVGALICKLPRLVLVPLAKLILPMVAPATPTVMPPVPCTASVLLTVVAPLRLTKPVPVVKLPVPDWTKLPVRLRPPLAVNKPVNVELPVTAKVPPKLVLPLLTVKPLLPVTVVEPFKFTAPVPVLKLPPPDCVKLPLAWL